ncbi:ABC transporter ATP-binding protein [bacterium]|nr:ABC transporter ATP-binding protein [bacterium]
MSDIVLKNISSRFVNLERLEINKGELAVLVGPSGAGKTSLLNIIAGFVAHRGTITLGQKSVESLPPFKRKIGYLFQDLFLFPHMTVSQNLKIAMKSRKLSNGQLEEETSRILEMFRVSSLASSFPNQLSGGEKQRVAMARAVASKPRLLLLDEPFSHLDYKTARYLRHEFKKLQKKLNLTTLFVTHNLHEAQELGDKIMVMENGSISQTGSFADLWLEQEATGLSFLEKPNLLNGQIQRKLGNGLVEFKWGDKLLLVADEGVNFEQVIIWPSDIHILPLQPEGPVINRFMGNIKKVTTIDHNIIIHVQLGLNTLSVMVESHYFKTLGLRLNDPVYVLLRLWCLRGISASTPGNNC